ncbi:MAG: aspartate kinase [Planctomycetota bacterium]
MERRVIAVLLINCPFDAAPDAFFKEARFGAGSSVAAQTPGIQPRASRSPLERLAFHPMIVMKFGGTSVGSAERIREVAAIVGRARAEGPVAVIVSAHGGVTDMLIRLSDKARAGEVDLGPLVEREHQILDGLSLPHDLVRKEMREARTLLRGIALLRELSPRSRAHLLSVGERMSARVLAAHLVTQGTPARAVMAWDAGLFTDDNFLEAQPLPGTYDRIEQTLELTDPSVPVITGFIARTEAGEITTLGRGGSDYSAAIFGAALSAQEIQIWTDVDGVLSTDPRLCPTARILSEISYDEAAELAFFGAKVLHPQTMHPAIERTIPIRVLNTFKPDQPGTRIGSSTSQSTEVVKSIALRRGVRVVNIRSSRMLGAHGFIRRLGEAFDRHQIPIDMMATSEVSVSVTVTSGDLEPLLEDLRAIGRVTIEEGCAIVCIVGEGLRETPGLGARIFNALGRDSINVRMISQGASRLNLGIVVAEAEAEPAVRTLHDELFGGAIPTDADQP